MLSVRHGVRKSLIWLMRGRGVIRDEISVDVSLSVDVPFSVDVSWPVVYFGRMREGLSVS